MPDLELPHHSFSRLPHLWPHDIAWHKSFIYGLTHLYSTNGFFIINQNKILECNIALSLPQHKESQNLFLSARDHRPSGVEEEGAGGGHSPLAVN